MQLAGIAGYSSIPREYGFVVFFNVFISSSQKKHNRDEFHAILSKMKQKDKA